MKSEGWVTTPGGRPEFRTVDLVPIDHAAGYLIRASDGRGYRFLCLRCALLATDAERNMSHMLAAGHALPMPATVLAPVCSDPLHREKVGQSPA